jgi:RNA polymerase sigma-70 factor (ECF subfamily)
MPETDFEIVRKILTGNENAYSSIIYKYKDKGMTLALNILKNREDAEEALQDAFIRAYKALKKFTWKSSFSTWFYKILYNVCCTKFQKRKNELNYNLYLNDAEIQIDFSSSDYQISDNIDNMELENVIKEELKKLDQNYSTILMMYYVQELGCSEISEVTGLSIETIKIRLFRGREKLRLALLKRFNIKTLEEIEV